MHSAVELRITKVTPSCCSAHLLPFGDSWVLRLSAHRGNVAHSPENTRAALISAFTAGADVLEIDMQQTADGEIVALAPDALPRMAGLNGSVAGMTLAELRTTDFGARFSVRGASATPAAARRGVPLARVETLGGLLDVLPADATLLLNVHTANAGAEKFARALVDLLERRNAMSRVLIASASIPFLQLAEAAGMDHGAVVAVVESAGPSAADGARWRSLGPEGLALPLRSVLDTTGEPTAAALRLRENAGDTFQEAVWLRLGSEPLTADLVRKLGQLDLVYAVSVDSVVHAAATVRRWRDLEKRSFAGETEEPGRISFGYAKANPHAHVHQRDGVHIEIAPYDNKPPIYEAPGPDPMTNAIRELREASWTAVREWPFYSGGGFGTVFPIDGDFVAEVDFSMEVTSQATMCEMAVTNIEPARHHPGWITDPDGKRRPNVPRSFRDRSSLFDPHGAPPFVGVEHDEDDGYRINYNLGHDYDANVYGRPYGNGTTKRGRFRLERRGSFFAAYYRDTENPDWVCCGVAQNQSMNQRVFLRCAGKRWRQEKVPPDPADPYHVPPANHFVFSNFLVRLPLAS